MTAVITLTASSPPVDVVDIDVDIDLALAGDSIADLPAPGALASGAPVLMVPPQSTQVVVEFDESILLEPTPQVTQMEPMPPQVIQMDFELDAPALAEPAPQVVQTYVQLDPPVLVDPLPPQVAQAVVDASADAADTL